MPDNKPMQFHVPPGTRDLIKAYAARRFPVFSDYVRSLIEADMRAAGEDIDLGVSRGPRPVEGEVTPRVESEVRPQPDGYSTVLAFDIGNTNINLGLWRDGEWALSWRARTVADKMPDEYGVLVRNFLNSADVGYDAVTGVIIGSVVPPLTMTFSELTRRYFKAEPVVVSSGIDCGVTIDIDQPEQSGADRIANASAVVNLYGGGPAIVVDFGTATNFDVVSANNAYIGGALAPGIGVAHDALVSRAARLHKVELQPPPSAIGRNTIHAMQSGIFWGYVALVEGVVTRIKAELASDQTQVIATGGLASHVQQHTTAIDRVIPDLTLDGLRVIYERIRP